MTARDVESEMLRRCAAAARAVLPAVQDQKEANIFRLAAMVVQSRFPAESMRLMKASDRYFTQHPNDKLAAVDVLRHGWVISLPRLRDMLSLQLHAPLARVDSDG